VKYFKAAYNLNCWLIALIASAVSLDIPVLKAGPWQRSQTARFCSITAARIKQGASITYDCKAEPHCLANTFQVLPKEHSLIFSWPPHVRPKFGHSSPPMVPLLIWGPASWGPVKYGVT
jgi:hypothetical protein